MEGAEDLECLRARFWGPAGREDGCAEEGGGEEAVGFAVGIERGVGGGDGLEERDGCEVGLEGECGGDEAVVLVKGAAKSLEVISGLVPIESSTAVPSPSSSIRRSFSSLSSHTLHPASTAILAASQSRILVNSTPKRCQPSTFFSSISRLLRIASIACGIFRAWA